MNIMLFAILLPFVAGIIIYLANILSKNDDVVGTARTYMVAVSIIELAAVLYLVISDLNGALISRTYIAGVGGIGLSFRYTGFRGVFGVLSAFAWIATFIYSVEFMKDDKKIIRYDLFNMLTFGATMGIFFAGDLFTVFFFFEIMSFTSFMWVAHRETSEAYYAGGTYLGIAIAGGMAILMGLFIVYARLGTLSFGAFESNSINVAVFDYINNGGNMTWLYAAAICMFAGFGAKASAFPVHVWLPQSYTEAPTPATALLSAILSKTGVFGIMLVTIELMPADGNWAVFVLVIGVITMVIGGIKGVMSGNLKTTLAYSSMSQIGFILVGVGMQGLLNEILYTGIGEDTISEAYEMAVNGTLLHMVNHSIVKLVLFMAAGIVFMNVGSFELKRVKGFGRNKPFLWVVFILAGAGVAGIPLLNGYVSKTLIHESIVEYQEALLALGLTEFASFIKLVECLFLFSGGLTVAYIVKLFVALFIEKNDDEAVQKEFDEKKAYCSPATKLAVGMCALPIPFIGLLPNIVARSLAGYGFVDSYINYMYEFENSSVSYFSLKNLSGAVISIVAGVVVYVLVVRLLMLRKNKGYREIYPKWLDMEKYVYRAVFYTAVPFVMGIISRILDSVVDILVVCLRKTVYCDRELPYELPEGNYVGHEIGRSMERFNRLYCGIMKKEYKPKHYEHKIAIIGEDLFENLRIIERSLSFGLFMFCVGLGLTLLYLLMVN